ncbi:MAG: HNH endonuclease [Chloroflexaceae bacterium]|nr:HNH endonuclease [Chloroflexaceae bacterium]NJO06129.1 HNH endonuclease [Chloroflexaceae bacterium]
MARRRERPTAHQKRVVFERARGCCEYCRSQAMFAMQPFSIEHIIPQQQDGPNTLDNMALACQGCNGHKYTRTTTTDPISGKQVPLFHPRKQRWHDHFAWNDDFTLVVGLTPIGRATVAALHLNRDGLINLRRALYSIGEHPPSEGELVLSA